MSKKLLIDAHQPEETRVVLLNGNKIEEFDYENNNNKQLKGNVYLAKVTRVEPSLQAAFVEYGGNRQGFLAFSEIHPDYYRIPIEDREALEAEDAGDTDDDDDIQEDDQNGPVTLDGDDDAGRRKSNQAAMRRYKIQEVITRKQILLVQVVKEERGNKGAALTTYLSLAGRYCVLMPNSSRGGGVSRKITNVTDRKRLKTVVNELDVPQGMAVIVRTAGSKRTKTEIKRDYTYLSKLWDDIRSKTLQSEAPCLINEEGSLVKRAIRDIYTNDVDEVLVEGDDSYKVAKAHMKMLIPSHAKRVVKYAGNSHLFTDERVEPQLDSIHQNEVVLKSGGYLVMNQTEALVAIDVNSGKATRERNIEETALKTNLEAAEEVGRQLRLRDLSGLIVIDFIDMEETRNQHTVERKLKEALRNDRARIQVGSISHFGLLEMSRQRLRPSFAESVSQACPHCEGTGRVRSVNSSALQILRIIEEEAASRSGNTLTFYVNGDIALYILNQKRASLADIENQANCTIILEADNHLIAPDYRLEVDGQPASQNRASGGQKANNNTSKAASEPKHPTDEPAAGDDEDQPKKRRRGRRGGRRRKKRNGDEVSATEQEVQSSAESAEQVKEAVSEESAADGPADTDANSDGDTGASDKPKRRRRRRGKSSSHSENSQEEAGSDAEETQPAAETSAPAETPADTSEAGEAGEAGEANEDSADGKAPARKAAKKKAVAKKAAAKKKSAKKASKKAAKKGSKKESAQAAEPGAAASGSDADDRQAPAVQEKTEAAADARQPIASTNLDVVDVSEAAPAKKKRGWWSRS